MRISGGRELVEVGAAYTFFCTGHPEGQAGVGFVIRTSPVSLLEVPVPPHGISPRLTTMLLKLKHGHSTVFISVYAPKLVAPDDEKEAFYECLNSTIKSVPFKH